MLLSKHAGSTSGGSCQNHDLLCTHRVVRGHVLANQNTRIYSCQNANPHGFCFSLLCCAPLDVTVIHGFVTTVGPLYNDSCRPGRCYRYIEDTVIVRVRLL